MDNYERFALSIILILALILGVVVVDAYHEKIVKKKLNSECVTTDYDKFQCYAMIYGDK
jgi:hypothetical protein